MTMFRAYQIVIRPFTYANTNFKGKHRAFFSAFWYRLQTRFPIMSSERWNIISYSQDLEIPLCGEVILLRYPIGTIDFRYAPAATLSSANTSHVYTNISASSAPTGNAKHLKTTLHHVLVIAVTHDKQNQRIFIAFFPIMSYSKTPRGVTGAWDADKWMVQHATDVERLNHLPIPAINWTPGASPSPAAPSLSFGGWLNNRCSWLGMVTVEHEFPETHKVGNYLLSLPFSFLPTD